LYCSAPFETRAEPSSLDPPVAAIHCYGFWPCNRFLHVGFT